ncbi:hypothetical protein IAU59_003911 [Kwoniella sp. CBS 9459]
MTTASPKPALPMPNGMFLHESPNGSSTSLSEHPDLALPNPAFRRRNGGGSGSNRSSIASQQDLNSLTSEELWALGHEQQDVPDMSNPMRQAAERPLDTVRRMSTRIDKSEYMYHGGLPGDVIWPAAPPVEDILPASMKSKSFTNVASLGMANRRMSKRGRSRQSSVDISPASVPKDNDGLYMHGPTISASPAKAQAVNGTLSSAQSSSTSLASQGLQPNKSFSSLSRPPSTYYSRDFLSSLAPREGGYAIAAQMGGGLGAHGTMSVEEKRRSSVVDDPRSRTVGSRAPLSKSAGMGRWSLDGGEHYGKPYATPSAATTSSNLSAPPINSAEPSPPADENGPSLPEGASPAISVPHGAASTPASASPSINASVVPSAVPISVPNPSPLSQQTSAEDIVTTPVTPVPPPVPASTVAPPPALTTKKSKKQLAKEAKAAEKAEAVKVARARAEAVRNEALKKQQAKEEAKRKEKEEKAKRKAEKKAAKNKKSAPAPAPAPVPVVRPVVAAKEATPVPPASVAPTPAPQAASSPTAAAPVGAQPFPKPLQSSQSAYKVPVRDTADPRRQTHHSMPLNQVAPPPLTASTSTPATSSSRPAISPKRSFFGTIKKRLSYIVSSESNGQQHKDAPPVPKIDPSKIPQVSSAQRQVESSVPAIARQHPSPPTSPRLPPKTEQLAERPPRRDSLAATASTPKLAAPVDLASLGDASSSTPKETAKPLVEGLPASSSPVGSPNFYKTVSNGASSSRAVSPAASPRKRNSLVGPRPMPENKTISRPSSMAASSADHSQSISQSPQPNSFSFATDQAGPVPVTPSTSGDSGSYVQSHASHMTGITPITSPSDTEDGRRSMDGEDGPVRESSKDSNETVHGSNALPPAQPVVAA